MPSSRSPIQSSRAPSAPHRCARYSSIAGAFLFKHRGRLLPLLAPRVPSLRSYSSSIAAPFRLFQLLVRRPALPLASIHGANGRHINFIHLAPTGAIQSSIQASRLQAPCQFHSSFAAPDGPHHFNSSSRQQAPHQFNPILLRCADGRHFIQASRRRAIIIHRCADWCHFHQASRRRAPIHIFSFAPPGAHPYLHHRASGRHSISSA